MRFGLKDVGELPNLEEFEKILGGVQEELFAGAEQKAEEEAPSQEGAEPVESTDPHAVEANTSEATDNPRSENEEAASKAEQS